MKEELVSSSRLHMVVESLVFVFGLIPIPNPLRIITQILGVTAITWPLGACIGTSLSVHCEF